MKKVVLNKYKCDDLQIVIKKYKVSGKNLNSHMFYFISVKYFIIYKSAYT